MQSVPTAGSRDRYSFDNAPVSQASPRQALATEDGSRPLDKLVKSIEWWLFRMALASAALAYMARMIKLSFALELTQVAISFIPLLLLFALAVYGLRCLHLVSGEGSGSKTRLQVGDDGMDAMREKLRERPAIEGKIDEAVREAEAAPSVASRSETHALAIEGRGIVTYRIVDG